jgi:hypothetical protein
LALRQLDAVYHEGADLGELAEELARHLRALMILTVGAGMESVLEEWGRRRWKTQDAGRPHFAPWRPRGSWTR